MSVAPVQPAQRPRVDRLAAEVLRHVRIRVHLGENVVHAFAEEFSGEPAFLRAASAFTRALPDMSITKMDDFPLGAIWAALDDAVAATEAQR